tara:strand:- start:1367 stop:1678 length:312 start_codon:yes stop_codon:yes gene_type:complete
MIDENGHTEVLRIYELKNLDIFPSEIIEMLVRLRIKIREKYHFPGRYTISEVWEELLGYNTCCEGCNCDDAANGDGIPIEKLEEANESMAIKRSEFLMKFNLN